MVPSRIALEPSFVTDRESVISAALGTWTLLLSGFAAVLTLLVAVQVVPPSRDQIRDAAVALVPPDTEITDLGENTGSELVSGQYFASAAFRAEGLSSEELDAIAVETAQAAGWEVARVDQHPFARETRLRRGNLAAELFVSLERAEGEWDVRENRQATLGTVAILVIAAPIAVLAISVVLSTLRRRPPNS